MGSWADGAVNETIGAGQDHTTITAFESAHDGETPTDGTLCTGTVVGTPADSSNIYWSGWVSGQNATTRVVLKANTYTDGDDGSGDGVIEDRLYIYGSNNIYLDLFGIEFHNASDNSIYWSPDIISQLQVALCVFRDSSTIPIAITGTGAVITRLAACLFKDTASGGGECGFSVVDDDADDFEAWNLTAIGATGADACYDEQVSVVGPKIFNCAGGNTDVADFEWRSNDTYEDYNASEDNSVNGTNSVTGLTLSDSDDFTAPSTDDYTVYDASSILYQAGTDQPSWFDTITGGVDMKGVSWHATTPSIGCFEFEVSGDLTLSPTDSISMSDSIIIKVEINKSDNVTLSDSIIKSIGLNKSDSISLSDNISNVVSFVRSLSDTINLTDELLKSVEIILSDTINLSDDFSAIITLILSLNDSITMSDSILKTPNINKSDAINISDEIIKSFGLSETDTINLTDVISKSIATTRSDTINMSDNFSSLITLILALNDTINMSDAISKEIDIVKSDTINLSDNIIKSFGLTKSDIINLADGFSTTADVIYALLNFVAENKTFNFIAKNKTFNFIAKTRGTE